MAAGPIDLKDLPSLVLCFDPDIAEATELKGARDVQVVSDSPVEIPGAEAARRLTWRELGALPKGSLGSRHLVLHTLRNATPQGVRQGLRQCGPNPHCLLVDGHGSWIESNGRGTLALSTMRGLRRFFGKTPMAPLCARLLRYEIDPPWPNLQATLDAAEEVVAFADGCPPRPLGDPPRVVHYIGALGSGGAERQLVLLARRQQARGQSVEVWTTYALEGNDRHYVPDLELAGVRVRSLYIHSPTRTVDPQVGAAPELVRNHLSSFAIYPLLEALSEVRPDVLHCWLDEPNTMGALAALLADVPRIVLSTRNVSPIHFPRLLRPWYRATYRALSRSARVRLVANSQAGAKDYAEWLGIDVSSFQRVYNGFESERFVGLGPDDRLTQRRLLGLAAHAFVVVGCFRLAAEKRPLDFVRVVARLRELVPNLRVLHLGVGAQASVVHAEAKHLGLDGVLEFRGRVGDPWRYLQVADASVLVSDNEGCPNVSLESQALGVPIVATRVGGTPETIVDGETGFLCDMADIEGIAQRLAELAGDAELRARMGQAGRALIEERFGSERMVEETLALYAGS